MGALEKLLESKSHANGLVLPTDEETRVLLPDLWELLTVMRLKDGSARKPSAVRVWLGRGDWSISLADEHTRQSLYANAGTLLDVFASLQTRLVSPNANWVQWDKKGGQKKS